MGDILQEATDNAFELLFESWTWPWVWGTIFAVMGMLLLLLAGAMFVAKPRFGSAYMAGAAIFMVINAAVWHDFGVLMHRPDNPSVLNYAVPVVLACVAVWLMGKAVREPDTTTYRVRVPYRVLHISLMLHVGVMVAVAIGTLLLQTGATDAGLMWRVVPPTLLVISLVVFAGGLLATIVTRAVAKPLPRATNPL